MIDDKQIKLSQICADALQRPPFVSLNCSQTGAGKTLMAMITASLCNRRLWVITPKIVVRQFAEQVNKWRPIVEAATQLPLRIGEISNIEYLRYDSRDNWITRHGDQYILHLDPDDDMLCIDEAHGVTGDSLNGRILAATDQLIKCNNTVSRYTVPVLLMSATLIDSPLRLREFLGKRMHLFDTIDVNTWLRMHGVSMRSVRTRHGTKWYLDFDVTGQRRDDALTKLNKTLFPRFGGRLKRSDIEGFPESRFITHTVELDNADIQKLDAAYQDFFSDLKLKKLSASSPLASRTFAKEISELLKVPAFAEMAGHLVLEGNAVIVFIYYDATQDALQAELAKRKLDFVEIRGGQSDAARSLAVTQFQTNKVPVLVCKITAGGVGVELGDLYGVPRATLISPPDSSTIFLQAAGRAHRRNSVSGVVQYIMVANSEVEQKIKRSLDRKLENIETIQDSDLFGEEGL